MTSGSYCWLRGQCVAVGEKRWAEGGVARVVCWQSCFLPPALGPQGEDRVLTADNSSDPEDFPEPWGFLSFLLGM